MSDWLISLIKKIPFFLITFIIIRILLAVKATRYYHLIVILPPLLHSRWISFRWRKFDENSGKNVPSHSRIEDSLPWQCKLFTSTGSADTPACTDLTTVPCWYLWLILLQNTVASLSPNVWPERTWILPSMNTSALPV